ncbi:protocatechuate 3,4-dioxygenase [Cupriavidus sp. 30B13]|uniref:dioxygenase family protein n=1 Tax=Cupriavidus sp. 30B13 TaxID=3384241 RepID=UPI003B91250F
MRAKPALPDDGRRRFVGGALGAGLLGLAGEAGAARGPVMPPLCTLTPELTQGPFYIDQALVRSDIRDRRPGLPLRLRVVLMDTARGCARVPGAVASIWHCDAGGRYSGVERDDPPPDGASAPRPVAGPAAPGNAQRFLRGVQTTRRDGSAQFLTIYPGWYAPRAVHIHLKIHLGEQAVLTTQMFFDDRVSRVVHTTHPAYRARGPSPVATRQDPLAGAHPGLVIVHRTSEGALLEGEFLVGVALA